MKILVDMNLSPQWCQALQQEGWEGIHWSAVGDPKASDRVIFDWAIQNGYLVFTHDLDFGAILASTQSLAPSVIQLRTQDVMPDTQLATICDVLRTFEQELIQGALISIDRVRSRVRILPLK
jgi:predicted nuclease of predicted toxin-antitoxin system